MISWELTDVGKYFRVAEGRIEKQNSLQESDKCSRIIWEQKHKQIIISDERLHDNSKKHNTITYSISSF